MNEFRRGFKRKPNESSAFALVLNASSFDWPQSYMKHVVEDSTALPRTRARDALKHRPSSEKEKQRRCDNGPVKWGGQSAVPDGKSWSLNKLSKAMRDSPRRVFLNSTTQDRTPWDDLFRLVAALILDRVSGTFRSACLMSLIARIVFVSLCLTHHDED